METNTKSKFLIDHMDVALLVLDDKDSIIEANKYSEKLFKTKKSKLIKKSFHSLFEDFDIKNIKQTIVNNKLDSIKRNLYINSKLNINTFVSTSITPIFNSQKNYTSSIVSCTDVSDKLELINKLTCSQEKLKIKTDQILSERDKFHMVIENISDGVIVMDNQYKILLYNSSIEKIIGVNQDDLKNSHIKKYFNNIFLSSLLQKRKYFKSGEIQVNSYEDHSEKILLVHLAPIVMNTGKDLNLVLTIRDITREKQIDEMKTQFVSNVSHELRTPLASIKGFVATLLFRDKLTKTQKNNFLNIINDESDRLARLIEDLLSLSRIEASSYKIQFSEFDLLKTIREIKQQFVNQLQKKNLKLDIKCRKNTPKMIADKDKIIQLIINLLNNAVKFTHKNTKIIISVNYNNEKNIFNLSIKDHGIGISKKNIKKIFNKFFRIENKVHSIEGTGLGLSIVKKILEKHNGRILVSSIVGKETTFKVIIPQGVLPLS